MLDHIMGRSPHSLPTPPGGKTEVAVLAARSRGASERWMGGPNGEGQEESKAALWLWCTHGSLTRGLLPICTNHLQGWVTGQELVGE